MGTKNRLCGWLAALLISVASLALAHDPGLSTATVKLLPGRLAAEATFARADIEALIPLDVNHDGKVSSQEWQNARPILEPLLRDTLVVRGNDGTTGMTEVRLQLDENDNFHVAGNVRAEGAKLTLESPLLKQLPRGHRQFISVLSARATSRRGAAHRGKSCTLRSTQELLRSDGTSKRSHIRRVLLYGR